MSEQVRLRAVCRVCSHAWCGVYECTRTERGLQAPENVVCPACGNPAGDFGDGGTTVGAVA